LEAGPTAADEMIATSIATERLDLLRRRMWWRAAPMVILIYLFGI
jgi:hypothetical protein